MLRDGQTHLWLKTTAGDVSGPYQAADPLAAALIVLDDGSSALASLPGVQSLPDGLAIFQPRLREPGHALECLHDALAAARFFEDFGVDALIFAGHGAGAGAALAAAWGSDAGSGALLFAPADLPITASTSRPRPPVLTDPASSEIAAWLSALLARA